MVDLDVNDPITNYLFPIFPADAGEKQDELNANIARIKSIYSNMKGPKTSLFKSY